MITGTFPTQMKTAVVIPLYKSRERIHKQLPTYISPNHYLQTSGESCLQTSLQLHARNRADIQ